MDLHEAMFYETKEDNKIKCHLCAHYCLIKEERKGICAVRLNQNGKLYSLSYGQVISENVDPIEKKPLFHFQPGHLSYSIAAAGCNFRCVHCQNYSISQLPRECDYPYGQQRTAEQIVKNALKSNCKSIAYTYTEPTIYFEFAYDTAILAVEKGLKNVFVTNGYITTEALQEIHPYLHAANIDLKSFSNDFYKKICKAKLQPVLDSIKHYYELGIWIEITTLIIPTLNDSPENLNDIASFIASIDINIPWHVSAFFPTYKLTGISPTTVATLHQARQIGLEAGLKYVYEGNISGRGGENTFCPECGYEVISRQGYSILGENIINGKCGNCGQLIKGIWT